MFSKNYSRLPVYDIKETPGYGQVKTPLYDKPYDSGYNLPIFSNPNDPGSGTEFSLTVQYIEGYRCGVGGCNATPIPKKVQSKRWFVCYKFNKQHHQTSNGYQGHIYYTQYSFSIWDNHGQKYNNTYSNQSSSNQTITITEDNEKYPEPLSDIVIDFIKGAPNYWSEENSIPTFKQKLETFYVSRDSVAEEKKELLALREEVAKLRTLTQTQQEKILLQTSHLDSLSQKFDKSQTEFKDQLSLTKTLQRSLENLMDLFEKKEEKQECISTSNKIQEMEKDNKLLIESQKSLMNLYCQFNPIQ